MQQEILGKFIQRGQTREFDYNEVKRSQERSTAEFNKAKEV